MARHKTQSAPPAPEPSRPNYVPTEAEVALVQAHAERHRRRPRAPRLRLVDKPPQPPQIRPDHPDPTVWSALLQDACGTAERAFAERLFAILSVALQRGQGALPDEATLNSALAALHGLAPRDEAEAMLAAQMVATYEAAMEMLGRAGRAQYRSGLQECGNLAVKLLRTYAAQLEALQRYRGKTSEQKVTVEHVHVHAGGQAVVGHVEAGANRGEGVPGKTGDQCHAKHVADAPEPTLRGADAERAPVPGAGGEG